MTNKFKSFGARGFLSRLRADQGGNTLAIVGAALVPLVVMIGGAVGASRAYMVKARLQQACDAGVLAGRKAVGEGAFDTNAANRAGSFFNNNFPSGFQGATGTSFTSSSPDAGTTVTGTATTILPTVIMGLFSSDDDDTAAQAASKERIQARSGRASGTNSSVLTKQDITLSVSCEAKLEVSNSDITMVLDTTGSMAFLISDGNGGMIPRIQALRAAMINFYTILNSSAAGSTARVRYAFVPYSSAVNVGRILFDTNPAWITGGTTGENWNYETRRAVYLHPTTSSTTTATTETLANITGAQCFNQYSVNQAVPNVWSPATNGYSSGQNATRTGNPGATYTFSYRSFDGDTRVPNLNSNSRDTCIRNVTRSVSTTVNNETFDGSLPGATFLRWEYRELNYPVTGYVRSIIPANPAARTPSEVFSSTATSRWQGCIEERESTPAASFVFNGGLGRITPVAATDLDIDAVPTGNLNSKWRPHWPEVMYIRTTDSTNRFANAAAVSNTGVLIQTWCPVASRLLTTLTLAEFTAYANSLTPAGNTYHDLGMLWGTRLSSTQGIFANNVNSAPPNRGFVSRNIIFMTDGELATSQVTGSSYGIEFHDRRVTTQVSDDQNARHNSRFRAVCEAAKAKGIRVWVIAFATSLSADLTGCASPSSAFVSTNAASLYATFRQIADVVADLRLSQ